MAEDLIQVSFKAAVHNVELYGLILIDLAGGIVTWNLGATQLLGFAEKEVLGKHFKFIFTPEDRAKGIPEKEMSSALQDGYAYDDRWHVRKNKSQLYVNGGLCLLRTEKDKPVGFVKIIRDQTEKREQIQVIGELNEKLIRTHSSLKDYAATLEEKVKLRTQTLALRNQQLQHFCHSVANDLGAPLRNIHAMALLVLNNCGEKMDPLSREYLERIAKEGAQLDKFASDFIKNTRSDG